jgi:MFS family permease
MSVITSHKTLPGSEYKPSHWKLLTSQALVTVDVLNHRYSGAGTHDDPFIVEWIPNDPRNPMLFSNLRKWIITISVSFTALAIAFESTAYSGSIPQVIEEFQCSEEVAVLGISLFVLGFAIGPLLWAPLSEVYGRQILFSITYAILTAFNAGIIGAKNIQTLLILRFFAGSFGSAPLTNSGGVIADMFPASHRGLAMCIFASAPFCGPTLGPIVGGFAAESIGWRWVEGITTIFTGVLWIIGSIIVPETYAPVLLKTRATTMSEMTGQVYVSKIEHDKGKQSLLMTYKIALSRPWILLTREPIVLLLSIYTAIVYGTLYLTFAAFPIVYEEARGWSQGEGGLAFIGVAVGMVFGIVLTIHDNWRYNRAAAKYGGSAPPEERLPPAIIGASVLPLGLFIFAWTNSPSLPWIISLLFTGALGFGNVVLFLSVSNYLVDSYTIFAASVLSANAVLRSLFGAAFPLFTTYLYQNLGIHWASSIPAFLALACVPLPFLFYKYGPGIRSRCKYAAEAARVMEQLKKSHTAAASPQQATTPQGGSSEERHVQTHEDTV